MLKDEDHHQYDPEGNNESSESDKSSESDMSGQSLYDHRLVSI